MPGQRDHDLGLRKLARQLRKDSTEAEQRLWRLLRDRRLSAYKFRRQVPVAGYILDFYCVKAKFVVEIDGFQHAEPEAMAYDAERTAVLNKLGIRVVRFSPVQVLKDSEAVCKTILRDVQELPSPQPSPGVPGEGARGLSGSPNASYLRSATSPS